jgi:hypothetical protein
LNSLYHLITPNSWYGNKIKTQNQEKTYRFTLATSARWPLTQTSTSKGDIMGRMKV